MVAEQVDGFNVEVGGAYLPGEIDHGQSGNPPDELRLRPVNLQSDAKTMFAGYIGRAYQPGGVVVVAINPGGGGDNYTMRTPADEVFYPLLKAFKTAADEDVDISFESANDAFVPIVQEWGLWKLLDETIDAARVTLFNGEEIKTTTDKTEEKMARICYLNVVPYRTRADTMPPVRVQAEAWRRLSGPLIDMLAPRTLVSLGKKAGGVVSRFYEGRARVFCVPRTIGDRWISDDARAVLRDLQAWSSRRGRNATP